MERKIAMINFKEPEGTLLAKALSCASGYQLALKNNLRKSVSSASSAFYFARIWVCIQNNFPKKTFFPSPEFSDCNTFPLHHNFKNNSNHQKQI